MPTKKKTKKATKTTKKVSVVKKTNINKAQGATKEKVESTVVEPIATQTATDNKEQSKKTVEVSRLFYVFSILMFVIVYAQLIVGITLYYNNYEIQIKDRSVATHQLHRIYPNKVHGKRLRRRLPKHVSKESNHTTANEIQEVAKVTKRDVPSLRCPPPAKRAIVFNEQEYLPYGEKGNAIIEGDLCFPLKDGSHKCFENMEVFINPVTSYSDEWYHRNWAGRENLEIAHPRVFYYNKKVITDKNGKFKFEHLPSGAYYVASALCVPETKDSQKCSHHRYAAKIIVKNHARPKLQQVYP